MRYRFFTRSHKAWSAMLGAISRAQESIYLEMYIFLNDTFPSHDFFRVLEEKARQGIRVRVVVDFVGSLGISKKDSAQLKHAGVEFLVFSSWMRRIHRKILIVDEQVVFIGGINIYQESRDWDDLMVRLDGLVVRSFIRSFARTYRVAGGSDKRILSYQKISSLARARLWLLDHWPQGKRSYLKHYYKEQLSQAQKNIYIVTPYFIPHRWFIRELEQAAGRGVAITVIIPEHTDHRWFGDRVNYFYAWLVARFGASVYLTPRMNHAKVLLIDDREGLVGSQNIDAFSFDFNAEAGVYFQRKDMVKRLGDIVSKWEREARPFVPQKQRMRLWDRLSAFIIQLFQPIL